MSENPLRDLPSVDRLLGHLSARRLVQQYGHDLTVEAVRAALDETRERLLAAGGHAPSDAVLIGEAAATLDGWLAPTLRRVINATGVIVHTNLGRAPLSDAALDAVRAVGGGYSTLEFDLTQGVRGSRSTHAEALLRRITGAEAAFVVNNNAAAVMLALRALAGPMPGAPEAPNVPGGREAVVSRGELIEIGGGFRMPDVMAQSGARLVEVGTTNRTHLRDYEAALNERTALILRAHRSNFRIVGFTTAPPLADIAALAHEHDVAVLDDIGSGALYDTSEYGLLPEPTVTESLAAGADLVMFSGDKLLGGPQAGILVGKAAYIDRVKHHPLARAVRPDKLCLAALTATLLHYVKGEALTEVPVWRMIAAPLDALDGKARAWADELAGLDAEVIDAQSVVGGGSLPGESLPTRALAIRVDAPDAAAARLRNGDPPIITRREDDRLIVDPRTVLPRDEADLLAGLRNL
jgi:L-seryl-tRNA(Ser) seleniumtransferase